MTGACIQAVGVLTGWGNGVAALPEDARAAAAGRDVIALPRPERAGDRFRRATRECLLGVAAVEAMLGDVGLARAAIQGARTGLVYVTAAAYGASNRQFVDGAAGTLHFPYTAPSAVPAEVAIEFGLTGAYVILIGGATATVAALGQAALLVAGGRCDRALVLAVETFAECADLYARGRWTTRRPLVEAAACALVVPAVDASPAAGGADLAALVTARAGETLACAPLIAAALARESSAGAARLSGQWRGRRAGLAVVVAARARPA